jgi:5-formyltetrahydrofolate cyclo-ligase
LDKAQLRDEARARRRAIPPAQREAWSERIAEHALALPEAAEGGVVGCYASAGSEVGTSLLLRGLLARGVVVAVPVVRGETLGFARLDHPWALVPAARSVPEPRQPWEEVDAGSLAVVFVPGLLFGRDGSRLGQGGGHFDRFLAAHPRPLRVGLAFGAQVVDKVPVTEEHDQGMDVIVTEEGPLRIGRLPS